MIHICLCDDNADTLDTYSGMLQQIADAHQIPVRISRYISGEQLVFEAEELVKTFDIAYLDMLMGKMNGIETARRMQEIGFVGRIIFLTTSKDHTLESFDVAPLHYLVKQDCTAERFEEVFLKAVALRQEYQRHSFVFETKNTMHRIPLEDILYFEVQRRLVFLHTLSVCHSFYSQIELVENQLREQDFSRCHRSFVVNLRHIRSISATDILLTGGRTVPVGQKYLKDLKHGFSKYLESKSVVV